MDGGDTSGIVVNVTGTLEVIDTDFARSFISSASDNTASLWLLAGRSMDIGQDADVLIRQDRNLTVDGILNITEADSIALEDTNGSQTSGIVVNGSMTVTDTTFVLTVDGTDLSRIDVNAGGKLTAYGSRFGWNRLNLRERSEVEFHQNDVDAALSIHSGAAITIRDNDFGDLSGSVPLIAVGDRLATIDLTNNWWGTTVATEIADKILDQEDNANRPTVLFDPFLSEAPLPIPPARIEGLKFNDLNGDGVLNAGEPGLGGVLIYVDADNDSVLDAGEMRTFTRADDPDTVVDETGTYRMTGFVPGTHVIRELSPFGFQQTFPSDRAEQTSIMFGGEGAERGITDLGTTIFTFGPATFFGGTVFTINQPELFAWCSAMTETTT